MLKQISPPATLVAIVGALFAALSVLAAQASATRDLTWKDLEPTDIVIVDVLGKLTADQRFDIETIAWARALTEEQRSLEQNLQSIEDAKTYEREFRKAGIDVDQLLTEYADWQVAVALRQQKVNNGLDGQTIKMKGYLLPLSFSENNGGETEFLLVPYVGACVHVPPPPPNQIVYVRLPKKMPVRDLYTPVAIEGVMRTKSSSRALFLVDGTTDVSVGYHLDAGNFEIIPE